jgi:heme-degrading monooxygenase HmoA
MISLPWTITHPSTTGSCTMFAGRLPLHAYRDVPSVASWVRRTRRHFADVPGLVGHVTAIELTPLALWTVSAWTSRADLARFDHSGAHRAAKSALRPRLGPGTFAVWTCELAELPVTWAEVRLRIDAAATNVRPAPHPSR